VEIMGGSRSWEDIRGCEVSFAFSISSCTHMFAFVALLIVHVKTKSTGSENHSIVHSSVIITLVVKKFSSPI
jgi:hypothetical protein